MSELRQKYKDFMEEVTKCSELAGSDYKNKDTFTKGEALELSTLFSAVSTLLKDESDFYECIEIIENHLPNGGEDD